MKSSKSKKEIGIDEDICNRQPIGECSEAEGCNTKSIGECSHAEGCCTEAKGLCSHAEGCFTRSEGDCSHTEGKCLAINGGFTATRAVGQGAHAEGGGTIAGGDYSHAEGANTLASGSVAHAEGISTQAISFSSHAEGEDTIASGSNGSHAEGVSTIASGFASHTEGTSTTASGFASHAEGSLSNSNGFATHVEGLNGAGSGIATHVEGFFSEGSGTAAHVEGAINTADGDFSHAEGRATNTAGFEGAHIMGRFGDACEAYGWFMAGGTNALTKIITACIKNSGDAFFGSVNTTDPCCADYAEMFETADGEAIDVGYFVTFDGEKTDKVRKANNEDTFILGVTSATPALLAGATDYTWQNRYKRDRWGRIQYETVIMPEVKDKNGNVIISEKEEIRPIINPEFNCNKCYTPRSQRPEWVAIGLLGKVLIRDDGSCNPGGYCKPNNDGIATSSDNGYRVLKRTDKDQILILLLYNLYK